MSKTLYQVGIHSMLQKEISLYARTISFVDYLSHL